MNGRFSLIRVRWVGGVWKQLLDQVRRLADQPGVLAGVALMRRPLKISPVLLSQASRHTNPQFLSQ
jgi:hypothetical protein